jgi:hypothetical protein
MASMKPDTKVNVDVPYLEGQDCTIYSYVSNIVAGVQMITLIQQVVDSKVMNKHNRFVGKQIKRCNPEALYHRMNSGTQPDLLEWQSFSMLCMQRLVHQYVLAGNLLLAWDDDDVLPHAKCATRERCEPQ